MTWRAAYELEPWGEIREDRRAAAGLLAAMASRGAKFSMSDALDLVNPWASVFDPPKPAMSLADKVRAFNAGIRGMKRKKAAP